MRDLNPILFGVGQHHRVILSGMEKRPRRHCKASAIKGTTQNGCRPTLAAAVEHFHTAVQHSRIHKTSLQAAGDLAVATKLHQTLFRN